MSQHRLSTAKKIGFTLGDYASNLYWTSVSIFLLFFYTDVAGLSAGWAGLIYMIASIIDALVDPVMGSIADRTRTKRGRYRPYILFGCVPLGLSFVLLYWKPPLEGLWLGVWLMITHIIFRLAYTVVTIPYTSLNARLTVSSDERSTLAGWRMLFGALAALTISWFTYKLVALLGQGNTANGFTYAAAVFAVVATAIYPLVYAITREPEETGEEAQVLSLRESWRGLAGNRAFWVLVAATVVASVCTFALGKSIIYYFKYYLHAEAAAATAFVAMAASAVVIIPAWVFITKVIGKRAVWLTVILWSVAMLTIFALFDFDTPLTMTIWLVAWNIGALGIGLTYWSMLPDTIEYGEWTTGARTESFVFGLFQFFLKVALGVGAGLFGLLLQGVGYAANVEQTPEALAGIKHIMLWLPGAGIIAAGLIMLLYPLRKGTHENIVAQLAARRKSAAVFDPNPAA